MNEPEDNWPTEDWPTDDKALRQELAPFGIVPVDPDVIDEHDLRGIADADAGRVISHEAMKRWLLSWGTDNPLPRPKCGE